MNDEQKEPEQSEPPQQEKITLQEMSQVLWDTACDYDAEQTALVNAGLRTAPDAKYARRAQVLVAACQTVELVKSVDGLEFRDLVKRKRKSK